MRFKSSNKPSFSIPKNKFLLSLLINNELGFIFFPLVSEICVIFPDSISYFHKPLLLVPKNNVVEVPVIEVIFNDSVPVIKFQVVPLSEDVYNPVLVPKYNMLSGLFHIYCWSVARSDVVIGIISSEVGSIILYQTLSTKE